MEKLAGFLAVLAFIGLVIIGWEWISQNANTIMAVATSIGLVGLAFMFGLLGIYGTRRKLALF